MSRSPWKKPGNDPLLMMAIVALLFAVGGLLVMAHGWLPAARLVDESPLLELKNQLTKSQDKPALVAQIRKIDADLRSQQQHSRRVQERGGWMLLLAVSLGVFALLFRHRHRLQAVPAQRVRTRENERGHSGAVIGAITLVVLVVGGGILWAYYQPPIEPAQSPDAVSLQPPVWPQFRGPQGSGVAPEGSYLKKWDLPSGQGIVWRVPTNLEGHGSPVLVAGLVCLTGMVAEDRFISCFQQTDGALAWRAGLNGPAPVLGVDPFTSPDTGWAASTPVTTATTLFALFGTGHAGAFDLHGKALWTAHLGTPETAYGFASSPVTDGKRFFVQFDQLGDRPAVLYAFAARQGELVWRAARPTHSSWATPVLADTASGRQLITAANPLVISYDPETGAERWRADVLDGDVAPSPIAVGDLVLVIEPRRHLTALRTDGAGDVTKTHVAWRHEGGVPDIPTPLATAEHVYLLSTEGRLHILKTANGEVLHRTSLRGRYRASPTLAEGNLYLFNTAGVGMVYRWQDGWSEIGGGTLAEEVSATPAFGDGNVYVRGASHLFRLGEAPEGDE